MITVFAVFGALTVLTPLFTKLLGRKVFLLLSAFVAGVFVWVITLLPEIFANGAITERVEWIRQFDFAISLRIDALSAIMALVVLGVGAAVLLYCTHYFSDDEPGLARLASLLFAFAGVMFGLVVADDVVIFFTLWEITTVFSYLLIGHYTGLKESRGAALQALLVTTVGGLAMLVGLVLISVETGTTSITGILDAAPTGTATNVALLLIILGAISKSALFPFHFWLPGAMAAPTPISAYLHAAAMVKAGVYLIARLAPTFAENPVWLPTLVTLGTATMFVGAWRALRQYDLKLLLAHGTVSQLGLMITMFAFGTPEVTMAATLMLVSHALFKSSLFLTVGIIDHSTGTRDWRQLTGLGKKMPVIAVFAALAAVSMAGIPPTLSFIGKELFFAEVVGESSSVWGVIALIGVALSAVLTVAYSLRFIWAAFGTREEVPETELHDTYKLSAFSPILLSALGAVAGLFAPLLTGFLGSHASSIGEVHELSLWHGFNLPLLYSALIILFGYLAFNERRKVLRFQQRMHITWLDSTRAYWAVVRGLDRVSVIVTENSRRGRLPAYVGAVVVTFIVAAGVAVGLGSFFPLDFRIMDYPLQMLIALVMVAAAILAAIAKQRITAVLLVGVTGYGTAAIFAFQHAPDLALTQVLVESVTLVAFVLVVRRLPSRIAKEHKASNRPLRIFIAVGAALSIAVIAIIALSARQEASIGEALGPLASEAQGHNIVNVILIDIRAWDTMGEISVLVAMATGIVSLLFITDRLGTAPRMERGSSSWQARARGTVAEPVTSTAITQLKPHDEEATRKAWLVAGRTLDASHRSALLEITVRLVFHPAIIISIYLLLVGHNLPGGGFIGGLVAGLAFTTRYLAAGRYELGEAARIDASYVLGTGLLLSVGTAIVPLFFGLPPLDIVWWDFTMPLFGEMHFGTSTIFDLGVYLIVVGLMLDILRSLGSEVDRHLEEGIQSTRS